MNLPTSRADALATNSPKYFTGKPCRNAHVAARYTSSGTCQECVNPTKNIDDTAHEQQTAEQKQHAFNSRREALDALVEVKIRIYPENLPQMRKLAGMILVARFPALHDFDAYLNKSPTNGAGGTYLYRFRGHAEDVDTLRAVANQLMRAFKPFNAEAARAQTLGHALRLADEQAEPEPDFDPSKC
jgi:hypothetical protein